MSFKRKRNAKEDIIYAEMHIHSVKLRERLLTQVLLINSARNGWCLKIGVCGSKRTAGISKSSASRKECIYSMAKI